MVYELSGLFADIKGTVVFTKFKWKLQNAERTFLLKKEKILNIGRAHSVALEAVFEVDSCMC